MDRVIKWLEPCSAFGIGCALNLILSVAAYAEVINPRSVDPQWIAVAGATGGLVSALVHIGVVSPGPEPAGRREVVRAILGGVFAVMVGAIVAGFLGPQPTGFFHDAGASDLRAVGFGIGMGGLALCSPRIRRNQTSL